MDRTATITEVPDCVKHDFWVGKPLFLACVREGRRILDTFEADTHDEAVAWARDSYGLTAIDC